MAREKWDKRASFVVAAIGSAIGLGNIWRFPYMAYSSGGGAFFIPYLIALITTGIPLLALEYYLGIRFQKGPSEAFNFIKKKTNFIGWLGLGTAAMITFYYTVVMSWACNYMFYSVGVDWAGDEKSFFFEKVLRVSHNVADLGGIQWYLALGNLVVWIAIFLIIFKGIKVVGKVVHWTVGLPWALLLLLIVRGISLNGAAKGLDFYLRPDFSQLLNPNVWLSAYGQIFFSLSLGFGIMIAYASYLPKDSDINTNAWTVSFANCITSYFAGFAVFSILGYLAFTTNQPIADVADSGPGLAFVTYPSAIAQLPGGKGIQAVFGIMFFLMLLNLGLTSAFSLIEAIVTGLKDSLHLKREKLTFWICLAGFLAGFLYTSRAGLYWLDIVDHWMNWSLIIVGFLEAVLIGWFFDIKNVSSDIDSTSEIKLGKLWIISVKYITPAALFIIIVSSIYREFRSPYEGYPIWSLMAGGWILAVSLVFIAFIMQNIRDVPRTRIAVPRFAGWLIIYSGTILAFYEFYTASHILIPFSVLLGSLTIGSLILFFSKRR
ncbi:MAG: sodium-dependent transporter [Thermodesulfobacteriota bacterium]|nr:sodium-dependent transporter [Thermodesulfobacteriota bacterium]